MTAGTTTPPAAQAVRRSRSPRGLWWPIGAGCAFGVAVIVNDFGSVVRVFPAAGRLALALLVITAVVGVAVLCRVRPIQPPPRWWAWTAVLGGATAATGCAVLANTGLQAVWARAAGIHFAARWSAALTAPLNEELLKLCVVVLLALAAPWLVRGPLDGFVLGAFTGLGFQVMENWTYALNAILLGGGINEATAVFQSFVGRVVFTGLGSHAAMTAVAGTAVGIVAAGGRTALAAGCVLTAMAMHFLFDAPLLGGVLGLLAKVLVNFVIAAGCYLALRHAYRRRARAYLRSPDSAFSEALLTRRSRRRVLRRLPAHQQAAARAHAAADLAVLEDRSAR